MTATTKYQMDADTIALKWGRHCHQMLRSTAAGARRQGWYAMARQRHADLRTLKTTYPCRRLPGGR